MAIVQDWCDAAVMPTDEAEEIVACPSLTFHGPAWFAEQLDVSEAWVRKNVKSLPHHKVGKLLKFDEHCIEIFRDRTAVAPVDSMQRTELSRNRRRK